MSPPECVAPLVLADDLRLDVDGVPSCDGLALTSSGARVVVLGAPRVLFTAVVGLAPVLRGKLEVRGVPTSEAARRGLVAGAAKDPPTPGRWTVTEYVTWSARLMGLPDAEARRSAENAIARLKLDPMARTALAKLVPHARRATVVAAALATGAEILVLEDPLGDLPDEAADSLGQVLAEALAERAWLVFAPRASLGSALVRAAADVLVLGRDVGGGHRVEAQGTPAALAAGTRRFLARFDGPVDVLRGRLDAEGATLADRGSYVLVDLGSTLTTGGLLRLCAEGDLAILELVPSVRALE